MLFSLTRFIQIFAIALCCTLIIPSVFAQNSSTAPILLDGRFLFEVSKSGQYSAQQRADEANRILQEIVERPYPPIQVQLDTSRELPIILVDGNHLLSVTSQDVPRGRNLTEQAKIWTEQLTEEIRQAQYERTQEYRLTAILLSIGAIVLALILSWGVGFIWQHWLQPLLERENEPSSQSPTSQPITQPSTPTQLTFSLKIAAQIVIGLIRMIIWLLAFVYISRLFPQTRQLGRDFWNSLIYTLFSDIFSIGDSGYSILDFLILIGLLIGLVFFARTLRTLLQSRVLSLTGLSLAAQDTIALITNYTIIFIGAIVLLQIWGLDITSLTVFAGVLGVGIGLGIQGIAKEFVSGLVLIFERPIQVGDFVEVGELMGTVERISVRSTEIRTLDRISVILPNSRFLESEVINWSHRSPISRLKLPVGIAYGSNLTDAETALLKAAQEHREVLSYPVPQVFFRGFGDNSLNFELLVWIAKPEKQFQIKSDLYFRVDALFREYSLEIPFPQRDLHLRTGDLPATVSPQLIEALTELSQSLASWLKHQTGDSNSQKPH